MGLCNDLPLDDMALAVFHKLYSEEGPKYAERRATVMALAIQHRQAVALERIAIALENK